MSAHSCSASSSASEFSSSSSSPSRAPSSSCSSSFGRIFIYGRGGNTSDLPSSVHRINVTSRSHDTNTRRLSPFFLGPVAVTPLSDGVVYSAQNVENAWQFSKCYSEHENDISEYKKWMKEGFEKRAAERFPMGRGSKPQFSYHLGQKLSYIEARIKIYAPIYAKAVETYASDVLTHLKVLLSKGEDIALFDFDGYRDDLLGMSLKDVLFNPAVAMGHAFVIKMILLDQRIWETEVFSEEKVKIWNIHKGGRGRKGEEEQDKEEEKDEKKEGENEVENGKDRGRAKRNRK